MGKHTIDTVLRVRGGVLAGRKLEVTNGTGGAASHSQVDVERARHATADEEFDAIYADVWRVRSARFWSPIAVARLAASWLTETGVDTVLDVGSGVGKFCLVGAVTTSARFVGLEHRQPLVEAARRAAERLGVTSRAQFVHGEVDAKILQQHRAMYLFNPFAENLYGPGERIDSLVELGRERYERDVHAVDAALQQLPEAARLVTYHGFGGHLPDNFDIQRDQRAGSGVLRLWVKSKREARGYFVERDEGPVHVPFVYPDLPSE